MHPDSVQPGQGLKVERSQMLLVVPDPGSIPRGSIGENRSGEDQETEKPIALLGCEQGISIKMVPLTRPADAGHPLPLGEGFAPKCFPMPLQFLLGIPPHRLVHSLPALLQFRLSGRIFSPVVVFHFPLQFLKAR